MARGVSMGTVGIVQQRGREKRGEVHGQKNQEQQGPGLDGEEVSVVSGGGSGKEQNDSTWGIEERCLSSRISAMRTAARAGLDNRR